MRDKLFDLLMENNDLVSLCTGNRGGSYWHFCYAVKSEHHFCIMNNKDKITFQRTVTVQRRIPLLESFLSDTFDDCYISEEIFTAEEILQRDDFEKDIKDFVIFNIDLFG